MRASLMHLHCRENKTGTDPRGTVPGTRKCTGIPVGRIRHNDLKPQEGEIRFTVVSV